MFAVYLTQCSRQTSKTMVLGSLFFCFRRFLHFIFPLSLDVLKMAVPNSEIKTLKYCLEPLHNFPFLSDFYMWFTYTRHSTFHCERRLAERVITTDWFRSICTNWTSKKIPICGGSSLFFSSSFAVLNSPASVSIAKVECQTIATKQSEL